MQIKVAYAHLHEPLFLAGTNHGNKLYQGAKGIDLTYLTDHQLFMVKFNKQVSFIQTPTVASWTPAEPDVAIEFFTGEKPTPEEIAPPKKQRATHKSHPMVSNIQNAQVSDPTRGMK